LTVKKEEEVGSRLLDSRREKGRLKTAPEKKEPCIKKENGGFFPRNYGSLKWL